jgi:hypothetical protein
MMELEDYPLVTTMGVAYQPPGGPTWWYQPTAPDGWIDLDGGTPPVVTEIEDYPLVTTMGVAWQLPGGPAWQYQPTDPDGWVDLTPPTPPPVNTVRPLVTGTTVTGSNLTSTTGTWTDATTYARAWTRDGATIAGATGAVYALVGADEGALIGVIVTATGPGGEASMDSLPVGPITPPPLDEEDSEPTTLPSRAAPVHRAKPKKKR